MVLTSLICNLSLDRFNRDIQEDSSSMPVHRRVHTPSEVVIVFSDPRTDAYNLARFMKRNEGRSLAHEKIFFRGHASSNVSRCCHIRRPNDIPLTCLQEGREVFYLILGTSQVSFNDAFLWHILKVCSTIFDSLSHALNLSHEDPRGLFRFRSCCRLDKIEFLPSPTGHVLRKIPGFVPTSFQQT